MKSKARKVPDVAGPTAQLCWAQKLDAPRAMVRCDRRRHHKGLHSWELVELDREKTLANLRGLGTVDAFLDWLIAETTANCVRHVTPELTGEIVERFLEFQRRRGHDLRTKVAAAFPDSWLDSILTGPEAVLGKGPYGCPDIERVVAAIKARVLALWDGGA